MCASVYKLNRAILAIKMSLIIKYNLFQFKLFVYLKCYYYVQGRGFTRLYFLIIVFVILGSWQYICTKV